MSREEVEQYHLLSSHRPERPAPGPGQMEWESQPDPFRHFVGAPHFPLPLLGDGLKSPADQRHLPSGEGVSFPWALEGVAALLELSLGLSAWKEFMGQRWALRCNPSSGNLHPTEGYLVVAELADLRGNIRLPDGVFHYFSRDHLLEQRWRNGAGGLAGLLPPASLLLGLSTIPWRESWKYGERAYRYCQLDVGHALAAVRYAAAALGWRASLLTEPGDAGLAHLLGLRAAQRAMVPGEEEHPDCLVLITAASGTPPISREQIAGLIARVEHQGEWLGQPNRLTPKAVRLWPALAGVVRATLKPETSETDHAEGQTGPVSGNFSPMTLAGLIHQRRSGQRYDRSRFLPRDQFFRLLAPLLSHNAVPPLDLAPWPALIHPVLMLHRVEGLASGLYILVRRPDLLPRLKAAFSPDFYWRIVAPAALPLYLLVDGAVEEEARTISCRQEIAADGAFSVGFLSDFTQGMEQGAWWYRRLFWEAGILGQILYLEAEAVGMRGTGIGCFFDERFHAMLGLTDGSFRTLYHFTVGGALHDLRLTTLPPYSHLNGRSA